MLKEIIEKYEKFPDCLIKAVTYNMSISEKNDDSIETIISCFNLQNENKREIIQIIFKDIELIKFSQIKRFPSLFLNEIYIKREKSNLITFDFFPIDHFDYMEENPNSEFIIKCKEITYKVLSSE
jgi:hypothetical protein